MCGRFVNTNTIEDLVEQFNIDIDSANELSISKSYNICPTQYSPVIFEDTVQRKIEMMHWGLIPSWSKDKQFSSNMINARFETIKEKPSFKNLINTNRCIVIASGYFEWVQGEGNKQPYYIYNDEKMLPMAGLWTKWEDILSFTIITTNAHENLRSVHHRMPLVLDDNSIDPYLSNKISFDESYTISNSDLKHHKVSTMVNSTINNNGTCIESIEIHTKMMPP